MQTIIFEKSKEPNKERFSYKLLQRYETKFGASKMEVVRVVDNVLDQISYEINCYQRVSEDIDNKPVYSTDGMMYNIREDQLTYMRDRYLQDYKSDGYNMLLRYDSSVDFQAS